MDETPKLKWGPIEALVVTVGSFFAAQIVAGLLLSLIPLFNGWSDQQLKDWLNTAVMGQFLAVLVVEAAVLALVWLFLRSRKAHPADIGLVRFKRQDVGYALGGYVVYFIVSYSLTIILPLVFTGIDVNQRQELGFDTAVPVGLSLIPVFVSLVLLPPITEEILMRGFLYTGLRSRLPIWFAALVTSGLFAVMHLQPGSGQPLLWVAAIDTFALSFILIYLRQKTGSLWPAILVHMFKNALAFVLLFVLKVV